MNGRERFLRTMARQQTDRPPFDFWAENVTIERLFEYLGHRDLGKFLDEMDVDIRGLDAVTPPEVHLGDGVYQNYWGERYKYRTLQWGTIRDDLPGALSEACSLEEIKDFPWPKNDDLDYSNLRTQCEKARGEGRAVRYGSGDVWQRPALVRGMQNALVDMYDNPEWMHYMSSLFAEFYKEEYRRAWEESGGNIDFFVIYSDLGSQRGALISVDMFRTFVVPYLQDLIATIHKLGGRAMYHSCGDVSSFIPDIIKAGVDILDPIQPVTDDMLPEKLARYKQSLCFHGGIDVQNLLPFATSEEIHAFTHRCSAALAPSYILSPTHFFQPDIPPENIIAVYQGWDE
jgi:uroporphyrinogen decarboxylase